MNKFIIILLSIFLCFSNTFCMEEVDFDSLLEGYKPLKTYSPNGSSPRSVQESEEGLNSTTHSVSSPHSPTESNGPVDYDDIEDIIIEMKKNNFQRFNQLDDFNKHSARVDYFHEYKEIVIDDSDIEKLRTNLTQYANEKRNLFDEPRPIRGLLDLSDTNLISKKLNAIFDLLIDLELSESIKTLDLRDNKLETLSGEISYFPNLIFLRLGNNKLKSLPRSIGQLSKLEKLSVRQNLLESLPDSMGDLTKLKFLFLQGNKLTTLPESITNLKQLDRIVLERNRFTKEEKRRIGIMLKREFPKLVVKFTQTPIMRRKRSLD